MSATRTSTTTPARRLPTTVGAPCAVSLLVALAVLWPWSPAAADNRQAPLFADGFESGNVCVWSRAVTADACDGLDADCDGSTDEDASCDDQLDCTTDTCAGSLGCIQEPEEGLCLIADDCVPTGAFNPLNPCEVCDPAADPYGWSPTPGTPCANGTCNAAGTCECTLGWDDCDGDPATGCETDITSDVNHCGQCQAPCTLPNATAQCVAGECAVLGCFEHFADCDAGPGCETALGDATTWTNTCETAISIGDSICGDQGADSRTRSSIGSRWYKVRVRECDQAYVDLGVAAQLAPPADATYSFVLLEGACDATTVGGAACLDADWGDEWFADDDKTIYFLVYHESGSSCGTWTLTATGNALCTR